VANFFGDRWTFLQVNGYLWVLGGMVSQALVLERESKAEPDSADAQPEIQGHTSDAELPTQTRVPSPLAALY